MAETKTGSVLDDALSVSRAFYDLGHPFATGNPSKNELRKSALIIQTLMNLQEDQRQEIIRLRKDLQYLATSSRVDGETALFAQKALDWGRP